MLRDLTSSLAPDINNRDYLPLLISKFKTCTQEDLDLIGPFIDPTYGSAQVATAANVLINSTVSTTMARIRRLQTRAASGPAIFDALRSYSPLLYNVVVFSELHGPLPSLEEVKQIYEANPFSRPEAIVAELDDSVADLAGAITLTAQYCRATGSQEEVCKAIRPIVPKGPAFAYQRDKYPDAPIKLTDKASALVLTGGFDFQTPAELGRLLVDKMTGGRGKKLVTFDYGGHCRGEATAGSMKMPCRNSIVKQYLLNDGDVTKIDTSCLKNQPKPVFPTTIAA